VRAALEERVVAKTVRHALRHATAAWRDYTLAMDHLRAKLQAHMVNAMKRQQSLHLDTWAAYCYEKSRSRALAARQVARCRASAASQTLTYCVRVWAEAVEERKDGVALERIVLFAGKKLEKADVGRAFHGWRAEVTYFTILARNVYILLFTS
jgi:hypothetical protein